MDKSIQLTPEQRQAVEQRGSSILVSAAAGSGKTKILIDRILALMLEERAGIESMLIVTFTNAAAREMKERLEKNLILELEKKEHSDGMEEFLRLQMRRLSSAPVSTMHAFCLGLIREYFHRLDLDPTIRIGKDRLLSILKQKAMEDLLEQRYDGGGEAFFRLVEAYGGDKNDIKLQQMILDMHRFIQSNVNPLGWLKEKTQELSYSLEDFEKSPLALDLKRRLKSKMSQIAEACQKAFQLAGEFPCLEPYKKTAGEDLNLIKMLESLLEKESLEVFLEKAALQNFARLPSISKSKMEGEAEETALLYKEVRSKEIKGGLQDVGKLLGGRSLKLYLEDLKKARPLMQELYEVVGEFQDLYQQKKRELGVLDFGDIEHLALKLLEEPEVCRQLQEKFDYIFFDEYQDSNLVQEEIIGRICRKNNLFFVGDVKQSIYKFRLAEPALFNRRYARYSAKETEESCAIDLTRNFRSRREILDFSNYIFSRLMSKELGDVDYKEKSHQLVPGSDFLETLSPVELVFVENAKESDEEFPGEERDPEAEAIARRVLQLRGQPRMKPGQEEAIYEFKDMVILMRSPRGRQDIFARTLNRFGIPVYLENQTQSYQAPEISMLLDFLRVVDNSLQDEPLLGALASPFGKMGTKELAQIRSRFPEGSFALAAKGYAEEEKDEIADKYRRFMKLVEEQRLKERLKSLTDFLWELMISTDYYATVGALKGGEERQNNLSALALQAGEFDGSTGASLFGFLRHVDKLLKERGDTLDAPSAIAENQNVVRLMSIHKSKGLEFPAVFLADTARRFNMADFRESMLLHNELGLGPKIIEADKGIFSESLPRRLIKERKKEEILAEEVRILYVALTRAQDRLIITGTAQDLKKLMENSAKGNLQAYLQSKTNYLSWLAGILIRSSQGQELRRKGEVSLHPSQMDEEEMNPVQITFEGREKEEEAKKAERRRDLEEILASRNCLEERFVQEMKEQVDWKYPWEESRDLPIKLTVSQIAKGSPYAESWLGEEIREEDVPWDEELQMVPFDEGSSAESLGHSGEENIYWPQFLQKQKTFTAAERGTLFHRAFQHLHRAEPTGEGVEQLLEKMVTQELLTPQERKVLSVPTLTAFLQSDLGQRIASAEPEVFREKSFSMSYEGFLVDGKIDCYFFEGDRLILVDYKTDLTIDEGRYKKQMQWYARALELWYKQKVEEGYIYWTAHGKTTKII